jgi:hypothetical protein
MVLAMGLAVAAGVPRLALAVPGEVIVEDGCEPAYTLHFGAGSAKIDLAAEAQLNEALQWVIDVPGRSLRVLGADGEASHTARLGAVRADAAASFLVTGGVNPALVSRGDLSELDAADRYALTDPDTVVVLACSVGS